MEAVGVYVRISSDVAGEGLGVARQETDCRALAERRGWPVAQLYVDNDTSAFSGKARPAYKRLLEDIRTGRIDGVIAWHGDRLHRSPTELERFIDLIEATGCQVETVQSGPIDLATPSGRLNARVVGAFARYESEHKSARVRRKLEQNAIDGKHHGGSRPYGWRDDRITVRLDEAAVVRTAADLLVAGNSVKAIVRALNNVGARNTRGGAWRDVTVRSMLLRPRNAGLRQHHGEVIGPGQWEPILDRDQWERVRVNLTDPARRTNPGSAARVHLLTGGIGLCGVCGAPLRIGKGKAYKGVSKDVYRCSARSCVSRDKSFLDDYVSDVVRARLARPDAAALLSRGDSVATVKARADVETLRSRLSVAAADFADGTITAEQLRTITGRLRPRIDAAERLLPSSTPDVGALEQLVGAEDIEARWAALDVSVRRQIVALLVTVKVIPARRGHGGFDPAAVVIEWRTT
ncbi:MAG: recombinase family protein [Sporichthyaceae bacterium]